MDVDLTGLNDAVIDTWGQTATVDGTEISAVFDNSFDDLGLGPGVEASEPQITCKTTDVSGVTEGVAVVVNGTDYKVSGPPEPDGLGMTILKLLEV